MTSNPLQLSVIDRDVVSRSPCPLDPPLTPSTPVTPVTPDTPPPRTASTTTTNTLAETPLAVSPKPLASREMFFPLVLYCPPESEPLGPDPISPPSVHNDPSPPTPTTTSPPTDFDNALARIAQLDAFLTPGMKSTLTCMLSVLAMHLSPTAVCSPHSLITRVASAEQTPDAGIKDIVDTIERGLMVFCALGGGAGGGGGSAKSVADSLGDDGASGSRKRQKLDADGTVSKPTRRSEKVRRDCKARDPVCQICGTLNDGEVAHIIPYSVKEKKAIDFWKFVELFRGVAATAALREIALGHNTDTVRNVWFLCKMCHGGFDGGKLSVIPDLDGITYPYDPEKTNEVCSPAITLLPSQLIPCIHQYPATIEFPRGNQAIQIACWKRDARGRMVYDRTLDEGHIITLSTNNPLNLPLPHPLLFQVHAIICRVIALKAAAGFPLFPGFDRGDYDDSAAPAFVDSTFAHWLDHHAPPTETPPETPAERYDSPSAEPRIVRWLKMTPAHPLGHYLVSGATSSESDSDPDTLHLHARKRDLADDSESDKDDERPRKFQVVMSEVGQRMAEKWQMVDQHVNGTESVGWGSGSADSASVY